MKPTAGITFKETGTLAPYASGPNGSENHSGSGAVWLAALSTGVLLSRRRRMPKDAG